MSEGYGYELTPSAVTDLDEILRYVRDELLAPDSALQLLEEIQSAVEAACAFPFSLPTVKDPLLEAKGYRKILVRSYIAFVIPDRQRRMLTVMRVMYHARNYLNEL